MCWCGFTYDMRAVSDIAHEHGAYVLNDAIQSVGAIDVDVKKDDVDFLLTGSYKWQYGPEGAGARVDNKRESSAKRKRDSPNL